MKRWNERVEKRMEELGLDKNDKVSIDIASESLEAEESDRKFGSMDQDSEGLWLGGADRGRKRDYTTSFQPNSSNSGDSEEDSDSDEDSNGDGDVEISESRSGQAEDENGNAENFSPVPISSDSEEDSDDDDDDTEISESSSGEAEDENGNGENFNPVPVRPRRPRMRLLVDIIADEFVNRLPIRPRWFARSELPAENSKTQKPVNGDEQLGSSGGHFWEALMGVRARISKKSAEELIEWTPSIQDRSVASLFVPSLVELSLKVLAENANGIASLNLVPYFLRKKLIDRLCDTRRMSVDIYNLLLQGCTTELRVKNCSWLTDDQFQLSLQDWQTENLRILQLDLGDQIKFDFALRDKLAQSPNSFSMLAVLSLRGAYCLTDTGVELLVQSAPAIVSVNLGQCSLLTFEAVKSIADYLGEHLRELYIDGCKNMKAILIENSITKFKELEVVSVAGLEDISDGFIDLLVSVCGESLKDLDVADCLELTDSSLRAIAGHCPGLLALNISRLLKVTNVGMEFLANGCRSIERLNLTRTKFSDEVIAAFLETSGKSLTELTLNYVSQVGPNTAYSLARRSRNLSYLDISWCRRISTNALGMIVDSCLSLKLLKVFGCKQIDSVFLHGHSNPLVRVIGFGLMPILDHVNLLEPVFLRYSPLPTPIDS